MNLSLSNKKLTKTIKKSPINKHREVKREAHKQLVKSIAHQKVNKPNPLRKDPNVQMDPTLESERLRIEKEGYGTFPAVDLKEMNPHKEHVLKALKDPQNNSGVISIVGKRQKFDLQNYLADPSPYLNSVSPGRAFETAQAGPDVKRIVRQGQASLQAKQGETVTLSARVSSNAPLSLTTFDGGKFSNGLSFITLKADSSGFASAEYTPTSGVINQVRIRAASPLNSGTLQWTVNVHLTDKKSNNNE